MPPSPYRGNVLLGVDNDTIVEQFVQFLTSNSTTVTVTDIDGNPVTVQTLSNVSAGSLSPSGVVALMQTANEAYSAAAAATGELSGLSAEVAAVSGAAIQAEADALGASGYADSAYALAGSAMDTATTGLALAGSANADALGASGYADSAYVLAGEAAAAAEGASAYADEAYELANQAGTAAIGASGYAQSAYDLATEANAAALGASGYADSAYDLANLAGAAAVGASGYAASAYSLASSAYALAEAASGGGGSSLSYPLDPGAGNHVIEYADGAWVSDGGTGVISVSSLATSGTVTVEAAEEITDNYAALNVLTNASVNYALALGNSDATNLVFMGVGATSDSDPMGYLVSPGGFTISLSDGSQEFVLGANGDVTVGSGGLRVHGNTYLSEAYNIGWYSNPISDLTPRTWISANSPGTGLSVNGTVNANTSGNAILEVVNSTSLATTASGQHLLFEATDPGVNVNKLQVVSGRTNYASGVDWTTTFMRVQRSVDSTNQGWIQLGYGLGKDGNGGAIGYGANSGGYAAAYGGEGHTNWDSSGNWRFSGDLILTNGNYIGWTNGASGYGGGLGGTTGAAFGAGPGGMTLEASVPTGSTEIMAFYASGASQMYIDATGGIVMQGTGGLRVGYNSGTTNSVDTNGWFRSSGNTGWLASSWGIGIYAIDSTYVRTYNSAQMAAADFVLSSDRRLKRGIRPFIFKGRLNPVTYYHTEKGIEEDGFISQDFQDDYPSFVGSDPSTGMLNLSYGRTTVILAAQANKNEDLLIALRAEFDAFRARYENTLWNRFKRWTLKLIHKQLGN